MSGSGKAVLAGIALVVGLGLVQSPVRAETAVGTAPPLATLSPLSQAVRSAVVTRFGATDPAQAFYAARGYAPIWFSDDGMVADRTMTLLAFLGRAGEHGLPAARYEAEELRELLRATTPGGIAEVETRLSAAYLRYASDVHSGLLTPRRVDANLYFDPPRPDLTALLRDAVLRDMPGHLAGLAPQHPHYQALMRRYSAFRRTVRLGGWGALVPRGRTLRPGDRSHRVAALRTRLTAMGDYPGDDGSRALGTRVAAADTANDATPQPAADPNRFDDALVRSVRRFQTRHGLNPDGAVGPATLAAINTPAEARLSQIIVTLERLRWLNRDLGERHILVNLAGFTMDVMRGGVSEFTSRVVIGKARKHQTPEFSKEMTHMVINPKWYVPSSIAREEILPKLEEDPDYLVNRNMQMIDGRIIQASGPGNALGRVKFMFPNRHAIYLHDTPSRRLFRRDIRAYSHGCIRVAEPIALAEYLLQGQETDPAGAFGRWLRRGRERYVNLDDPLPVHLTYRTAWVDAEGRDQFRGDIYGRDGRIADALELAGVPLR